MEEVRKRKGKGVSGGLGSEDENKNKKKTYVQIDPQQDSETYCIFPCEKRNGKKKERKKERRKKELTSCIAFAKGLLAAARDLSTYSLPAT